MAALTTFLTGVVIGGALKWVYDKSQEPDTSISAEVQGLATSARQKSAELIRRGGESVQEAAETVEEKAEAATETVEEAVEEADEAIAPPESELPIDNYDELTVAQIEPLLSSFSADELHTVKAHEEANANRVTLLRQIESELESQDD